MSGSEPAKPLMGPEHPLEVIRLQRGWTYKQLANIVANRARGFGLHLAAERQKTWRWVHRGIVPDPTSQRALAAELGIPFARLESDPWPGWLVGAIRPNGCIPTEGDRRDARILYAALSTIGEVLAYTAETLPAGTCALAAAYAEGDRSKIDAEMRELLARADAHNDRIRQLTGSSQAFPPVTDEDLSAAWDTFVNAADYTHGHGTGPEQLRAALEVDRAHTAERIAACGDVPAPADQQDACPSCGHANVSHDAEACAVVGCTAGPNGKSCTRTYGQLKALPR